MSARLLILCPGQGSQHPGMFDLARTDARAAAFLDGCAVQPDAGTMFENRLAQPLIVAATLAMWEALTDHVPTPALVAGYSIGELAAWSVSGAISPLDAVALATDRAALMDHAAQAAPQSMVAISGLAVTRTRDLALQAGFKIAIVTGEDSCIAGGLHAGVDELERAALAAGARVQVLPVAIASHTPLLAESVFPFAARLEASAFAMPRCPVLSGIDATRLLRKEQAVEHLSRQLAETIEWSACMDAAVESGITVALELGPGCALSRMFQARHPNVKCRSAAEFRGIEGIAAWLGRHFD